MSIFKSAKSLAIVSAAIAALLGLLFILFPGVSANLVCYILVGIFTICGLRLLVLYFRNRSLSFLPTELLSGLALLAVALVLLLEAANVAALLPVIFGAAIAVSGVTKGCHAFELKRFGWKGWPWMLGAAILGFAFGLLMLINPFKEASTAMILTGAGLLYSGISDLAAVAVIARRIDASAQSAAR